MAVAAIAAIGTVFQFAGMLRGGRAAKRAAERERQAAEFMARQLDEQAIQDVAVAQRRAFEERRRATLAQSRTLAVAAASGGGAGDVTVVNLISGIAAEGSYRSAIAMYEGRAEARQKRIQAKATRISGRFAAQAGRDRSQAFNLRAIGTAAVTGVSLYQNYGGGGPAGDEALIEEPNYGYGG